MDRRRARELLDGPAGEARRAMLDALCPCQSRLYDRELWERIVAAHEQGEDGDRDLAGHALATLQQRAPLDPRSRELLRALDLPRGGLTIAAWGPRNRPSRRKRMTPCVTGRAKRLASDDETA